MKIIIINNLYKPYKKGGAENFCEMIIDKFTKDGHFCQIITTKTKKSTNLNNTPKTHYIKSNYYELNKKGKVYRIFWQIANIFNFFQPQKIKKILKNQKPDLIITNNLMGIGLSTFKIIKSLGIKHHHVLHDIQLIHPSGLMIAKKENKVDSIMAKIYQFVIKKIIGSPDLIISPSNWLIQEHKKRNYFRNSETKVQRNPQPLTNIGKIDKTELNNYKNKKKNIDFLFIGQIEEHKGIIFLIETFKRIEKENIKLKIIGNGALMNKIIKIADIDNRIEILGQKNKEDVAVELQKSDCLIVPSLCYENSPTVIYEAKTFSLPIIASNLGGIPELITSNLGILFEAGNQKDLTDKITKFIRDKQKLTR